jgi:hypothetical protein
MGEEADEAAPTERLTATFEINLDKLKEMSALGVRRAAAFLGIGLNSTANADGLSIALVNHSMWRFFSEPEPKQVVSEAVSEFRIWVTGNALRELDAFFSRFLDGAWYNIEFAKLHGTTMPSNHTIKGIESDTNVGNKFAKVVDALGRKHDDSGALRSFSLARNSLSHNHGVVAPRHTNVDGALEVRWLGLETRLQQGEEYVVLGPVIGADGIQAPDPSKEAEVVVKVVQRVASFKVGERILLQPADLHEICFNYLQLTDVVMRSFHEYLQARGIAKPAPVVEAAPI